MAAGVFSIAFPSDRVERPCRKYKISTSAIALLDGAIALNERAQMDEETAMGRSINLKIVSQTARRGSSSASRHRYEPADEEAREGSGLNIRSLRYLFDGERINPLQTPKSIGIEDGNAVDAVMEQTGGGPGGPDLNAFSPPPLRAVRRLTPMTKRLKTYKASLPGEPVTFKDVSRDAVTKPWPAKFVAEQECKEGFNKKCVCRNRK